MPECLGPPVVAVQLAKKRPITATARLRYNKLLIMLRSSLIYTKR